MGLFDKAKEMAAQAATQAQGMAMQKAAEAKADHDAAVEEKRSAKAMAKELAKGNKAVCKLTGNGETMILKTKSLEYKSKDKDVSGDKPLTEITAARVESGEELQSRVTVTRLVLVGIFAFALKKKKGGEKYLTVDGEDFVWAMEVDRKHVNDAVKFAAKVNNAAKAARAQ